MILRLENLPAISLDQDAYGVAHTPGGGANQCKPLKSCFQHGYAIAMEDADGAWKTLVFLDFESGLIDAGKLLGWIHAIGLQKTRYIL